MVTITLLSGGLASSTVPSTPAPEDQKENYVKPNRRTVLRTGIAVSAAGAAGLAIPALSNAAPGEVAVEHHGGGGCPTPPVSGEFSCAPDVLSAAADDFGHFIHRTPKGVLKPSSADDVASLVRWAKDRRIKVAARGQGHSTFGRSMVQDGIVVDMGSLNQIHSIAPDRVVVDAGVKWSTLLQATLAQGLTPPVLTAYIELSVGGTLSVGGVGATSHVHGVQTDNVIELEVVTGDGRKETCSATRNAQLFNAVRAGLGQCAIITKATLKLVPAPARVRRYQLFYPSISALTSDMRLVLADGRFDHLQGNFLPDGAGGWRFRLEGGVYYNAGSEPDDAAKLAGLSDTRASAVTADFAYSDYTKLFGGLENLLRSNGQWFNPHPWWLSFLPGSNAEQTATQILSGLTNDDVGQFGLLTFYPVNTSAMRTPLFRIPNESVIFAFNVVRFPTTNDLAVAEQMVTKNRALYDTIRGTGGVQYAVSAFPMSSGDWRAHFGPKWTQVRDAKYRFDPRFVLDNGYEVF
jgi:cytokinin dehydrogenase